MAEVELVLVLVFYHCQEPKTETVIRNVSLFSLVLELTLWRRVTTVTTHRIWYPPVLLIYQPILVYACIVIEGMGIFS